MESNKNNSITISLVFSGEDCDYFDFMTEVGIFPSKVKKTKDWPKEIIENEDLPKELRPRCEWVISADFTGENNIEDPIKKFFKKIKGKETIIKSFSQKRKIDKSLIVVINCNIMQLPEIILSQDIVRYLSDLEMEIGFDFYFYED